MRRIYGVTIDAMPDGRLRATRYDVYARTEER